MVVVVATYDGVVSNAPWLVNSTRLTYVIYQRTNPSKANFVPNVGFEAGVYLRFILDNYDDLPAHSVYIQDQPEMHNRAWLEWTRCLLPGTPYAPLVPTRLLTRDFREVKDGLHAVAEQCFRNFLGTFGLLEKLLVPMQKPTHAYYGGDLFVVSREALRRHPRSAYRRADALVAGGDGRCHLGALDWDALYAKRQHHAKTVELDEGLERGKHTFAAFERLQHVLFGDLGLRAPYRFDWCAAFLPSFQCFGSPCHGRLNRSSIGIHNSDDDDSSGKRIGGAGEGFEPTAASAPPLPSPPSILLSHHPRRRHNATSGVRHARWYLLPYRGSHKRFARRQELVLEAAWRQRRVERFLMNATFKSWKSSSRDRRLSDTIFNVSLPRMSMWAAFERSFEHIIRRLPVIAPAWWLPGRQACGFELDGRCMKYNLLNAKEGRWNRSVRAAAARQGTVTRTHSTDTIREIL